MLLFLVPQMLLLYKEAYDQVCNSYGETANWRFLPNLYCSSRPTLYVGKYSTSLYASPSMVHEGVTIVVS